MKIAICLLAFVATVICEQCTTTKECEQHHLTVCGAGSNGHIGCSDNWCTCLEPTHNSTACMRKDDCVMDMDVMCRGNVHCVDNVCRCEKPPSGNIHTDHHGNTHTDHGHHAQPQPVA